MFKLERHAVDIEHKGETTRLYARELGYVHFRELSTGKYPEPRWQHVMEAVTLASIESDDGKPAFTAETWRVVPRGPVEALVKAAWKAQGVDVDKPEAPGAATEGNV